MSVIRTVGALALVITLPACATVIRGTKQSFAIDSVPTSAAVELSTGQTCTTPCTLKLKRKDAFTAHVTHDGYQPVDAAVASKTRAGAIAGNLLLGGVIGAAVDATDGSLQSLMPNPLHVTMVPAAPATVALPAAPATAESAPLVPVSGGGATPTPPVLATPSQASPIPRQH